MELKPVVSVVVVVVVEGLNRTFYGIETRLDKSVVPCIDSLNRTFYGIETLATLGGVSRKGVLMDQLQFSVFAFYLY